VGERFAASQRGSADALDEPLPESLEDSLETPSEPE
jgi:hypothetical protein